MSDSTAEMKTSMIQLFILTLLSGLSHGAGFLPDHLNGALGGSVMFTTTINQSNTPFLSVSFSFTSETGHGAAIINSPSVNVIAPGYEDRITLIRSTASLELRNLTFNDNGEYRLSVVTDGGELMEGRTILKIDIPVSKPVITPITGTNYVEFNDTAVLSCSVSSGTSLSYLWLNGSSEVTPSEGVQLGDGGSTLTIVSVTRYDQGPFRCHVFNPISDATSPPVHLFISCELLTFGPGNTEVKASPSNDYIAEGSDLTLSCSAVSSPAAVFQWFLNGNLHLITGPELKLLNIQIGQSGNYTCQAFNSNTLRYQNSGATVTVLVPVSNAVITPITGTDYVEFNDTAVLTCSVSSGSLLSYLWLNGSSEVTPSEGVQIGDGGSTLTIVSVTRYDQGPFRCHVFNPISDGSSPPVQLFFSFGPGNTKVKASPSNDYIAEGSDLTLSCSAVSSPTAVFQWFLNGDLHLGTGPKLNLLNIQIGHSGNYICQAFNSKTLRYQNSGATVTVLEKISGAVITPSTIKPVKGTSAKMTCSAEGSIFTRDWMKDDQPLTPSSDITFHDNNTVLSFSALKQTDSGQYLCRVSNPISSDKARCNMTVNRSSSGAIAGVTIAVIIAVVAVII